MIRGFFTRNVRALDTDAIVFIAVYVGLGRAINLITQYCEGVGDLDSMQTEIETFDKFVVTII